MDPLVSVIVPLYNYEKYISSCIKSILKQDYPNFELFVADDCSKDNSYAVAKRFEASNVHVFKLDKNRGYSRAKNEAIIKSKGELITTLDADDMFTIESISCRVKAIADNKVPFVHANALSVQGDVSLKQCYAMKDGTRDRVRIHAQTIMLKRWVFQKYGLFDEDLRSRSDKEMWWRLFGKNDKEKQKIQKIKILNDVAYYRHHGASMMKYRHHHPEYNRKMTALLNNKFNIRQRDGVTSKNTRFLET